MQLLTFSTVWMQILCILALTAAGVLLTGCESVTRYSISSNQGPMPMEDHYQVEHFR